MNSKVFYSWQSDLPNSTNRGFIEQALEKAVKAIRDDDSLEVEPVIDRDVQGIPGSPDIGRTIFSKIDQAAIFVCDVSIINPNYKADERPTPNPNVLIELGYALKVLGQERILLIMNTAYGKPEILPFDLRLKLVVSYEVKIENMDKATERRKLENQLVGRLKTIFQVLDKELTPQITIRSLAQETIQAINDGKSNKRFLARKYMEWLGEQFVSLNPELKSYKENDVDELLVASLEKTINITVEFAELVQIAVVVGSNEVIKIIYEGFTHILKHYTNPKGFSGHFSYSDFDFYKFMGHELFVILISFLIQEEEWELIGNLLDEEIFVENLPDGTQGAVSFTYISDFIRLLDHRNNRLKLNQVSVHGDILQERHTKSPIANLVPMNQFIDADVLLYFCSKSRKGSKNIAPDFWRAWSIIYMQFTYVPRYLSQSKKVTNATKLLRPFGLQTVEELRIFLMEYAPKLKELYIGKNYSFSPLSYFNPNSVGTL